VRLVTRPPLIRRRPLQIGSRCVVDPSAEEEPCASAVLHFAVGPGGRLGGATKTGAGGIPQPALLEMMEAAQQLGPKVLRELDGFLAASAAAASARAA
jgi:exosome complex RNA-binding protein Rrp42 (RNase PH superfamily)